MKQILILTGILALFACVLGGCTSASIQKTDDVQVTGSESALVPSTTSVSPKTSVPTITTPASTKPMQTVIPSATPSKTVLPALPSATVTSTLPLSSLALIPGGTFEMGDHYGYVDPQHPTDELPIHNVDISQFSIGKTNITVQQYCDYLNSAFSQGLIRTDSGKVYLSNGKDLLFQTRQADQYSRIGWNGSRFSVLDNRGSHPVTGVMWFGAATYCNWLSNKDGYQVCYDTTTWECDFTQNGYRLPTEAEWEYAARGGQTNPYYNYPWGNEADKTKANWPGSGDPYEAGPLPWTTPVGFYNGQLQKKSDFSWPGGQETYQTSDGANGYGLYDMAGNVWQWCNDWYGRDYYKVSPTADPTGPAMSQASPAPDGKLYRAMRGGNWYNGEADAKTPNIDNGHSRVSNRDPAYFRGPQDPDHPYYHVGFRVARRG
jgi:formylglycine-generating enzyme required for sulfatase activity